MILLIRHAGASVFMRKLSAALCAIYIATFGANAGAQAGAADYPNRPIRFIVPFGAGGLADIFSRALAQDLWERMGQPVVVDNRAGANEAIGIEAAAKSAPDGYTIMLGTLSGLVLNTLARKQLPYDPVRDFAPVSQLLNTSFYLVVHPSLAARSTRELIVLAKSNPGKLTYGSTGIGSIQHLGMALLASKADIKLVHVPYKAAAQATTDIVSGQVDILYGGPSTSPHIASGRLRAIAYGGAKRSVLTPDLPTVGESGAPGCEVLSWMGLVVPAATPRPIVQRLHAAVGEMLRSSATRQKFATTDLDLVSSTPEEFGEFIRAEFVKWTPVMRQAGIQPE